MAKSKRVATGIYWQSENTYRIELSTGRRLPGKSAYEYYKETFHGSVEEAKTRRAYLITERSKGRLRLPDKKKTLGNLTEEFAKYNRQRVQMDKISLSTADYYEQSLRRNFDDLWDVPLSSITADDIIDVFLSLKDSGASADYLLSIFGAFRATWRAAPKRLKITVPDILDDVTEMMPGKVSKHRIVLQPKDFRKLLKTAEDNPITHGIVTCLINTLTRINECLALRQVPDVDFDNMIVTIHQQVLKKRAEDGNRFGPHKTYRKRGPRSIRMTNLLAEELRSLEPVLAEMRAKAGVRWQENDLWFPTSIGTPYSYSAWEHDYWLPLLEKADLPRVRVHDVRHSAITYLLAEGVSPAIVQEIAGHSDIATTMGYKHLLVNAQDEAMGKIDQSLRK
jgi:integrase